MPKNLIEVIKINSFNLNNPESRLHLIFQL